MCLCNGSGGIQKQHTWGIEFIPCPDTNCKFDKKEHERKYAAWKQRVVKKLLAKHQSEKESEEQV